METRIQGHLLLFGVLLQLFRTISSQNPTPFLHFDCSTELSQGHVKSRLTSLRNK